MKPTLGIPFFFPFIFWDIESNFGYAIAFLISGFRGVFFLVLFLLWKMKCIGISKMPSISLLRLKEKDSEGKLGREAFFGLYISPSPLPL